VVAFVIAYMVQVARRARAMSASPMGQATPEPIQQAGQAFSSVGKMLGIAALLLTLYFVGNHLLEKWHPPLEEHRHELMQAAVNAISCPPEKLTIVAETPRQARVEGCGSTRFFLWGRQRSGERVRWREIDPSCTVDWLGFKLPCY